jgi:hypothetical protein
MMPMSSPWWFAELPESMTEADYRDLSEEISRTIEIVHGHVIKCEFIVDIREFHLDAAASVYRLHAVHHSVLDLEQPVRLTLPISDLVAP